MSSQVIDLSEQRLSACEEKIEAGLNDVWQAIRQIHHEGLYAVGGYATFEVYVEQRWGYTKTHAYRLIEAANIVDLLKAEGHLCLPTTEGQTRELQKLKRVSKDDTEYKQKVSLSWQMAQDQAPKKLDEPKITAQNIQSVNAHFGLNRSAKRKGHELQEVRDAVARLMHCKLLSKLSGHEFHEKYGGEVFKPGYREVVTWLMEYAELDG